jgi:hypothetical protein
MGDLPGSPGAASNFCSSLPALFFFSPCFPFCFLFFFHHLPMPHPSPGRRMGAWGVERQPAPEPPSPVRQREEPAPRAGLRGSVAKAARGTPDSRATPAGRSPGVPRPSTPAGRVPGSRLAGNRRRVLRRKGKAQENKTQPPATKTNKQKIE